ncbi:response regulator [Xylanimonas ulmi]|uniref:response regulator n=1 Tax=Xylanimonas ulmi TaxID=228973 RepID=UPI00102ABFF0|nr:response regulator transcription factor [Xylanibacterium ulmi]
MTRVLIVDDDPLVRRLLHTVLTAQGIDVVGQAADGDEVVTQVAEHHPDVVLLDLQMPRLGGLGALDELRRAGLDVAVVVLSSFGTDETVLAALERGAVGFLGKDDDPDRIAQQVRVAASGRAVAGQQAVDALVRHVTADPARGVRAEAQSRLALLTDREREVASWLPHGLSNPQISARLYLGEGTVKSHLSSALTKLGLSGREQLAVLVDRAGATASLRAP